MNMRPKVSILMPAYNCELYVAQAIGSIIAQTVTDWELLVADDGSTDRTKEIIDSFTDPRIQRFHNESNIGLVPTWNKLLTFATGEFIAWQDADDVSLPTRIEKTLDAMISDPAIMLCGCNSVRHYQCSGETRVTQYPTQHEDICRVIASKRYVPFTGATRIIRNELLEHQEGFRNFFNGIGGEDLDFLLRVAERWKIANIPDALYIYRYTRHSNSRRTADASTYLKMYSQEVTFFLADQRKRDHGLDGLMVGGNTIEFTEHINRLHMEYLKDPSVSFRHACRNKISNQDYWFALMDLVRAILYRPTTGANHRLLIALAGSVTKTTWRVLGRIVKGATGSTATSSPVK